MPTAAAVIIGNEILTGKFADENGPFFIERLRALGTDLLRLSVIPDDRQTIAEEVRRCSQSFDFVFTTGGVGPTHDDITLESIALAFDRPLVLAQPLVALLEHFELPINEATLRMAHVPEGTELVPTSRASYPVLRCENVWIFPGIPKLMKTKFESVAQHFVGPEVLTARLYATDTETRIAEPLTAAAQRHPGVEIGSYPRFGEGDYKVIITLESRDEQDLRSAVADLESWLATTDPAPA